MQLDKEWKMKEGGGTAIIHPDETCCIWREIVRGFFFNQSKPKKKSKILELSLYHIYILYMIILFSSCQIDAIYCTAHILKCKQHHPSHLECMQTTWKCEQYWAYVIVVSFHTQEKSGHGNCLTNPHLLEVKVLLWIIYDAIFLSGDEDVLL